MKLNRVGVVKCFLQQYKARGVEKLSPENNGVDFYAGLQNNIRCVTFLWEILIHASLVFFFNL